MRLIGRREFVDFPELNLFSIEAKMDTGAYTSSIHCSNISLKSINNKDVLCFRLLDATHPEVAKKEHQFSDFYKKKIKNSFGEMEERYIIKTSIKLGKKTIRTTLSLSDRENMRYPVLIGRRLLKGKFIIDVNKIHTGGLRIEKVLKDYI
ncbi:MAG: ATP-dependent zinc protease [Sphingobacteriaceae bacterium]|nr:ATP-dependent zinc protease [Sphingobacteriaceae bacterium]